MKITSGTDGLFGWLRQQWASLRGPSDPLAQADIDKCASIALQNSGDIARTFAQSGGFIPWYNAVLSNKPAFAKRGAIGTSALIQNRFNAFWDQIPAIFSSQTTSAIEFSALMAIGIQENSGDLWSNPEEVGRPPDYPGLVYAFEAIPGLKSSYNVNAGLENWTAYKLFQDADYLDAHSTLPSYQAVTGQGVDLAWNTAVWPTRASSVVDMGVNGFVMEADFYKFRGRGIIQTTGRDDYRVIIDFILNNAVQLNKPALIGLKTAWEAFSTNPSSNKRDIIASRSTNAQWDTAFGDTAILAAGVSEDSTAKGDYLKLSHTASVLNGGITTAGSLYFMARKINAGSYPDQVVPMMKAMIRAIAAL